MAMKNMTMETMASTMPWNSASGMAVAARGARRSSPSSPPGGGSPSAAADVFDDEFDVRDVGCARHGFL